MKASELRHVAVCVACLGFTSLVTGQTEVALPKGEALFTDYNARTFPMSPKAGETIALDRVDLPLLSAAVFHETNRRRARHRLPALTYDPAARRAATLQAQIMARTKEISHENEGVPEHATLERRLASVGLKPRFAAENLAYTFAVRYRAGERLYVREENGQKVFSAKPGGPPVRAHTYLSFAQAVVDQWMNSQGHRENLLHRDAQALGVGCRAVTNDSGFPMVYCCQVFYTPLTKH